MTTDEVTAEVMVWSKSIELAVSAWLDAKSKRSGSDGTLQKYRDALTSFRAAARQAGYDLDSDARPLALLAQAWAGYSVKGKAVSPATYNQRLAIISSFYQYAFRHGLLEVSNPVARVERRPVQAYAAARPLNAETVADGLRSIDRNDLQGMRDYALLTLALQTGRRLSELAALRWGDVQVEREQVTVTWQRTKGGKVMRDTLPLPVGNALLAYLRALYGVTFDALTTDAPVWVSFSRNASNGNVLGIQSIADICEKHLGTSKVHALRHSFAHAMEDVGAKVSDIQARLGHSSLATTGRYLAALHSAENAHADALARVFGVE